MQQSRFIASFSPASSSDLARNRLLLALLWCALPGGAAALPEDADQPIHIQADRAEIDQNSRLVTYTGSVRVDQGTLRVTADVMTVEYENQQVVRITATGSPARYRQQIRVDEDTVRADALVIVYHTQDEKLDLKGNAFLTQEGNEITGDLIKYDIVASKVEAEAAAEERIRMILQPATRPD